MLVEIVNDFPSGSHIASRAKAAGLNPRSRLTRQNRKLTFYRPVGCGLARTARSNAQLRM